MVNAPLIPVLLKWTGLSQVSPVKAKIRAKAARAFTRFTQNAVKELKNDEDEMLRGEWVRVCVCMEGRLCVCRVLPRLNNAAS